MFLYARLVCGNLESQGSLAKIEKEVTNFPSGLYEALVVVFFLRFDPSALTSR